MTRLFREAVRYAAASVKQVAEEAGYSRITFDVYLNQRPPTKPAVRALAKAIEDRGQLLLDYAEKLREVAADDAPGTRRRTGRAKG
jgi:hypothetical protein